MRNAEAGGHVTGVVNVLAGAAGTGAMRRGAMIVKLQRDADDVVAGVLHERRHDRGIDSA